MRLSFIPPALLSLAGMAACSPPTNGPEIDPVLTQQILRAAVRQETAVDSKTLADRLLSNPEGLTLIDIRTTEVPEQGRIEGAKQTDPAELFKLEVPQERDLILYDADGSVSAQAVALLRINRNQRSYYLRGGYSAWSKYLGGEVKDSDQNVDAAREAARRAAIACRFEGDFVATAGLAPRIDAGAPPRGYVPSVKPATPPPPATDALGLGLGLGLGPAQEARPRGKLKIGEGC